MRGGEGGAGYLLGVKAQGADERAVLALRQGSSDRLRREVVSEARLVLQIRRKVGTFHAIELHRSTSNA